MQQYKKKQVLVKATQWHKEGDHPAVKSHQFCGYRGCSVCDGEDKTYYFIKSPQGRVMYVNPGYWILESEDGSFDVWSPTSFEQSFEPAPPPSSHQGDFKAALKEQVADESLDKLEKALFIEGATWAKDYLSQFTAPPTPVEGPWSYDVTDDGDTVTITDGKEVLRFDQHQDEDGEQKLCDLLNAMKAKLWSDDPSPLIISHLEEQVKELQGRKGLVWQPIDQLTKDHNLCKTLIKFDNGDIRRYLEKDFPKAVAVEFMCIDSPAAEQVDPVRFHRWMITLGWVQHSSGEYYYRLENRSQWPPLQQNMCDESELISKYTASLQNKQA